MRRRSRISRRKSKRSFGNGTKTHVRNELTSGLARGGYRL